jgi:hypothetical protein
MDWGEHLKWVIDLRVFVYDFHIEFLNKGWNSWNHYHCGINETVVRKTADAMVASGLLKAGYEYGRLIQIKQMISFYY